MNIVPLGSEVQIQLMTKSAIWHYHEPLPHLTARLHYVEIFYKWGSLLACSAFSAWIEFQTFRKLIPWWWRQMYSRNVGNSFHIGTTRRLRRLQCIQSLWKLQILHFVHIFHFILLCASVWTSWSRDIWVAQRWAAGWMIGDPSLGTGWEFFSSPPSPDRLWCPPSL